jgi:membrane protein
MGVKQRWDAAAARVMKLKPVRVFVHYNERRGPLLAAGLSFQSIFAVFAAIWVGFAIAGFVISANPALEQAILDLIAINLPGLFAVGGGDGVIDRDRLFEASILGWTGTIAAAGLLFTVLGWLASGREAVRIMFGLPGSKTNFLLLKLRDLGLVLAFSAAMLLSAVLSVLSTAALDALLAWVGAEDRSPLSTVAARIVGLVVVLVLDTIVLGLFYRVVSGIRIPMRQLAQGTIIAAVALGVLKALGTTLLGAATNNPLLASFAVIIGLLIWFNLICQVILLGSAWIAVSAADRGLDLSAGRAEGVPSDAAPSGVGAAL